MQKEEEKKSVSNEKEKKEGGDGWMEGFRKEWRAPPRNPKKFKEQGMMMEMGAQRSSRSEAFFFCVCRAWVECLCVRERERELPNFKVYLHRTAAPLVSYRMYVTLHPSSFLKSIYTRSYPFSFSSRILYVKKALGLDNTDQVTKEPIENACPPRNLLTRGLERVKEKASSFYHFYAM